jgi:hypothetical protein
MKATQEQRVESHMLSAIEFLAQAGLGLDRLSCLVPSLNASEAILLVGSVANGPTTPFSDINILVICENNPRGMVARSAGTDEYKGPRISIQHRSLCDVETIIAKLGKFSALVRNPQQCEGIETQTFDMLSASDISVLHHIRSGIALVNGTAVQSWQKQLHDLPEFITLYSLMSHFNSREDLIAQTNYGDRISALWMLSEAAGFLAAAMLASVGETNLQPRWRPCLLLRNEAALGKERISVILRYLLPTTASANLNAVVQHALGFFDLALMEILGRRETLVSCVRAFRKEVRYITRFDELTRFQASGVPLS